MERNNFKERCEVRMTALGLGQKELGELVGKPQQRINEAFRGEKTTAAATLRVTIDQALIRMIDEKRIGMIDDLLDVVEQDAAWTHNPAAVSLILPEDLLYVVTVDGKPVGTWNPVAKSYKKF